MSKIAAVLIDTVSIQKYVYASNKLKENLGASYIVDSIYREPLAEAVAEVLGETPDLSRWRTAPNVVMMESANPPQFEVGYIGGGNALLFFASREVAHQFIKRWTLKLLKDYPGLPTAVALRDDFELSDFQNSLHRLFDDLIRNKNRFFPNRVIPKHGITADCPLSGYSAEVLMKDDDQYIYVSQVSKTKREAAEQAKSVVAQKYADILGSDFSLPDDLDKLGQTVGNSHLATVYIDGNQMGSKFQDCVDLVEWRNLSIRVDEAVDSAFREVLRQVLNSLDYFQNPDNGFQIHQDSDGWTLLPIRPIVIAGDEVTFVTDGRLGVYLAECYLRELRSTPVFADGLPMSACAGIAITRTKYPFYRAYEIAEELCSLAKTKARQEPGTSWLDFHVAHSGISGTLSDVRECNYSTPWGNLHYGPYRIEDGNRYSFTAFKNALFQLSGEVQQGKKWSRNKIKEFLTVLTRGDSACRQFLQAMELVLPEILPGETDFAHKGWENQETPYHDLIEMLDFYPIKLAVNQK